MKSYLHYAIRTGTLAAAGVIAAAAFAKGPGQAKQLADSLSDGIAHATLVGSPSAAEILHIAVSLQPRDLRGLEAFCDSVSDPMSPSYRHFLTPEQVGERFGASSTDVNNVVAYLKSQGLKVDLVSRNRMAILASGSVAQIQKAFSTQIRMYRGPGQDGVPINFRANSTPLSVPSQIGSVVYNIVGIENYARPKPRTTLSPALARGLYNTAPSYANGYKGQGRKIGFSNWDGYRVTNAADFINHFSLPIPAGGITSNIHIVSVNGTNNNNQNGAGEADLDMQMELSAAPLADIYVYDGSQTSGEPVSMLTRESSDNLADVISESWGWRLSGTTKTSCHNLHLTMTAQGQTYLCASGDSGTQDMNSSTGYPYPDEDPDVTNVGGTVATVNTSTGQRITENGWNSSGGGWTTSADSFNVLPSWQHGNGVPTGNNHRLVPDIAGHSDSSGGAFYILYGGSIYGISGTSCASPYMASSLATLEQRLAAAGLTARMGRINDAVYGMNGRSDVWFDVTTGNTGTLPDGSSAVGRVGWDFVTGWGAPNFDSWYNVLAATNTTVAPASYQVVQGTYISGNVGSLANIDQNYLIVQQLVPALITQPPVDVIVTGNTATHTPSQLKFTLVAHGTVSNLTQTIKLYNNTTNAWDSVDSRNATAGTDQTVNVTITTNASRYVASDGTLKARITYSPIGATFVAAWTGSLDQTVWTVTP